MNSLQGLNSVANDSWENNPLAPFFKGESMIRQQYHSVLPIGLTAFFGLLAKG
jgi:hypothetical protein